MANALYAKGREKILSGAVNFLADTIKVALIKADYAQNLVSDEFFTSIAASVLNTPQTLTGKSVTAGVFDAADTVFPVVTAGDTSEGLVIYKDTGVAGTSPLLVYIDNLTGFPFTTNGSTLTIEWDNGAFKIFSL